MIVCTIHFMPRVTEVFDDFFRRNNLTVLELVVIQGQGARGQLKINDKLPSMGSLLLFELQSSHLTDCNSELIFCNFSLLSTVYL